MSTLKRISARFKLGSTFILLALVVVWSLPTLGLLITSLRRRSDAEVSPWWDAVP